MSFLSICPLCNGFQQLNKSCPHCEAALADAGKVTDYLDEYSAYEDISTLKMVDGLEQSLQKQECAHIFSCNQCGHEEIIVIIE